MTDRTTGRRSARREAAAAADAVSAVTRAALEGDGPVLVITGAGISTASGLPVYRHAPDAIWETSMVEWGTREAFLRDPSVWWAGYLDRGYESFRNGRTSNAAHAALAKLARAVPSLKVVTQNVDGLHDGCPPEQLVEVHGRLGLLKCVAEGCQYAQHESLPLRGGQVDQSYIDSPPRCPGCDGFIMTQFLCFDEQYESHDHYQWQRVIKWIDTASVFLFIGTSFAVGITEEALFQAEKRQKPCFQYNVNIPAKLRNRPGLSMTHILGESVETVTAFAAKVISAVSKSPESSMKRKRTDDQVDAAIEDDLLPTQFGSLLLSDMCTDNQGEGPTLKEQIIALVRKCAVHDWTYPLSVIEGYVPGSVYVNADCTLVVTTALCGFYTVVGAAATVEGCADVINLLQRDTGWEFLYSYPPDVWDAPLTSGLGAFRFERSCFDPPLSAPLSVKSLPPGFTVERVTTVLLKKYQQVYEWHKTTWPDPNKFLEKGGVGYVIVNKKRRVVAGCIGVFIGDGTHELDIYTAPRSRGKGFAQIAACHTMRELMSNCDAGGHIVSWACDSQNLPSRKIGEKLGFTFARKVACFRHSSMGDPKYDYNYSVRDD